jgi:hypothetical protein
MAVVLLSILLGVVVYDLFVVKHEKKVKLVGSQFTPHVALVLACSGFLLSIFTVGSILFLPQKNIVIAELNRWHILWVTGASVGVVISFAQKKWPIFSACLFLLLFDVYTGFRSTLAMSLIAIFTIWLSSKGSQRLTISSWKAGVIGLFCALFLFVYKFMYRLVKKGEWLLALSQLLNSDFYLQSIAKSEPFTTQAILNEIIRADLKVGLTHFKGVAYQFIFFSKELGADLTSFNQLFQPKLFPGVAGGMASNIWAEMWSSGGWPLLFIFILFFVITLAVGSKCLLLDDPVLKGGLALLFSYWAFYIHRNDLLFQVNLEKRVLFIWAISFLTSFLIWAFFRSRTESSAFRELT